MTHLVGPQLQCLGGERAAGIIPYFEGGRFFIYLGEEDEKVHEKFRIIHRAATKVPDPNFRIWFEPDRKGIFSHLDEYCSREGRRINLIVVVHYSLYCFHYVVRAFPGLW